MSPGLSRGSSHPVEDIDRLSERKLLRILCLATVPQTDDNLVVKRDGRAIVPGNFIGDIDVSSHFDCADMFHAAFERFGFSHQINDFIRELGDHVEGHPCMVLVKRLP